MSELGDSIDNIVHFGLVIRCRFGDIERIKLALLENFRDLRICYQRVAVPGSLRITDLSSKTQQAFHQPQLFDQDG